MKTTPYDLYLVAGNITIFCGPHSDDFKKDLLHSSLYSQLLAEKSGIDRELYWSTYTNTLGKLAWVQESNNRERVDFSPASLLSIITRRTQTLLSDDERQLLADAFSRLGEFCNESQAVESFPRRFQTHAPVSHEDQPRPAKTNVSNIAMTVTIIRKDKIAVTLQVVAETTSATCAEILDHPVLNPAKYVKHNIMVSLGLLDESNYTTFRKAINEKINSKIKTELFHIQAPAPD